MTLTPALATVALLAMMLGEAWRVDVPGSIRGAPIAQATAVTLAVSTAWPVVESDPGSVLGLAGPLGLALLASLVVGVAQRRWATLPGDLARTVTTVVVAGLLARLGGGAMPSLYDKAGEPAQHTGVMAVFLLLVAVVAIGASVVAGALVRCLRLGGSVPAQLATELGTYGALVLATATTAVMMALVLPVLDAASFVLSLVPMAVLQTAVTRQRRIHEAQRQTLVALSQLTDQAGLTAPGHATRVARLAVPVAREVGVDEEDLEDVEAAALLHDVGQVGLARPIPGGSTMEISARDQRRVATTGAAILARTADLSRLAPIVADVGIPHHWAVERGDVTLAARVVRAVSAYDDLTGSGLRRAGALSPLDALERILRATPHEFDPVVVDGLIRHLERRGLLGSAEVAQLRRTRPALGAHRQAT